jgi:hypothetical protein
MVGSATAAELSWPWRSSDPAKVTVAPVRFATQAVVDQYVGATPCAAVAAGTKSTCVIVAPAAGPKNAS